MRSLFYIGILGTCVPFDIKQLYVQVLPCISKVSQVELLRKSPPRGYKKTADFISTVLSLCN